MQNVEIKIYKVGSTALDLEGVKKWLDECHQMPEIPYQELKGPEILVALAGKRCYKSFAVGLNPNVTQIRKDWVKYLDNVLSSRHGSVLEHASCTFAIENVSRVFTGEMNRHRAGVGISEGSMRYIRYDDIPFWIPLSLRPDATDTPEITYRKQETLAGFRRVFDFVEKEYAHQVEMWALDSQPDFHIKKQVTSLLRRMIPMGVATGGLWTMNFRALRNIMEQRCTDGAEEEICYVMTRIGTHMILEYPGLFGDFASVDGFLVPKYKKV